MELFLNLVWASLVVAAALRFAQWSSGQPNSSRRVVALATICVLALLFPIISVTDDLHPATAVLEDANGVRRTATILVATQLVPVTGMIAILLTGALPSFDQHRLSMIGALAVDPPRHVREGVCTVEGVRPPPTPLA